MQRRSTKWIIGIAAIFLLSAGSVWADGERGQGPGKGGGRTHHQGPRSTGEGGRPVVYQKPPNFRPQPPRFDSGPKVAHHQGKGHGRPYVSPFHGHHRPAPMVPPPPPYHCHRPAPPVVHHYWPAPPPPAIPFGGFLFSAAFGDPSFAFGITIGDRW